MSHVGPLRATSPELTPFDISAPLPAGTVLLEASAGTGKTWTIGALVTRYVAEGIATLPEMLIVTFGRAASQELRARVREQLVSAEEHLTSAVGAGPAVTAGAADPLVAVLLDAPEDVRAERRRRIREALTQFDAATIATTHQFCQQVLRSLGVAGTSDASATLVDDLDDLLVEVVDDIYLRGFIRDTDAPFFTRDEALVIARTAVDDVHARLRPTAAEPGSPADRRVRFATAVREELDIRKRRLQVMHYNDLLTQLAHALGDEDAPARTRMRQRWQVVLVDEFQDTDPIQWEVLERAFAGHCKAMVLIGDPKQAIYAFRGGDIVTYLTAARTADQTQTLPRNHRSDAPLVDGLGVLLQGAALGDPQISVHRVSARHDGSRLSGSHVSAPFRLRQVMREDHLQGNARMPVVRAHIARDLAHDIAGLLSSDATFDGSPVQARDVAVLAHRGADLIQAQDALQELGIPAVSAAGGSVLQSSAAYNWLALLQAMASPHRPLLTRAAAITDLLGYSITDLNDSADPLDNELAQRCRDLAAVYARQGIAAVLEVLTADGLSSRVLTLVGGERSLTDLRHVAQLLHETAQRDDLGLVALLTWLRRAMADDAPQPSAARTRRLDSDAAAVQLVTIHGSKGLQYPVVYLPTLGSRWVSDSPAVPLFHEAPPQRTRCIDVGGPHSNPTWDDALAAHRVEDAGESLRLLYVALTRAQSQVVTWWAPSTNARHSPLHRLLFGRRPGESAVPDEAFLPDGDASATTVLRAWANAGAFALERADVAPAVPLSRTGKPAQLSLGRWTRSIDTDWRRTSYTALSAPAETAHAGVLGAVSSEPELEPRSDEPDLPQSQQPSAAPGPSGPPAEAAAELDLPSPMADLPVGATFGSLVHAVLEHADPHAPDLRAEMLHTIGEHLVQWPVHELDSEVLADALVSVCDTPLGPLAGDVTLREIGRRDRLCELDFELPLDGGDRAGSRSSLRGPGPTLGDLAPLLLAYLPATDPILAWAHTLESTPDLADQPLRGYLTGSVDVVLRTGGRFLVVDYKTNWLGPADEPLTAAQYGPQMLAEAMGHSSYPLQALLYAVVAHRFLRWRLPGYNPDRHLGGVLYLYVRGMAGPDTPIVDGHPCGVFSWRPPTDLVVAISDVLDGRPS